MTLNLYQATGREVPALLAVLEVDVPNSVPLQSTSYAFSYQSLSAGSASDGDKMAGWIEITTGWETPERGQTIEREALHLIENSIPVHDQDTTRIPKPPKHTVPAFRTIKDGSPC